jgi:competence protein ComEC
MISVTMAAQMFTWPLIIYYFHIFSVIAPVANLLILPLLPAILILSLLLALGGFWPLLAQVFAWPLFILLKIIVELASFMSQIKGSHFLVNNFSIWHLIFSLALMLMITFILKPYAKNN